MSGICGLASFDGSQIASDYLEAMIAAAPHRAVHSTRKWEAAGIALARLSTDVTPQDAGDEQPVMRGQYVIVADARIDNRDELLPRLLRRGYLAGDLETTPDSEIILAAHRCWGEDTPCRLVGDFAYVIWDRLRRRLLAARDPMGMRPLYHRVEPGRRVLVGSEVKQLLAVPGVPCAIDEQGIAATIAGPFLPADATVYVGIDQLAPGSVLVVDAEATRVRPYWYPNPSRIIDLDSQELTDAFRDQFARSVADRLRTSRPAGLFLSGGVDSGSIASMAGWLHERGRITGQQLRTYSWAFAELPDSDERATSDAIAKHYSLDSVSIFADDAWPLADYPDHGPDRDDPYMWVYQALHERAIARCVGDGVGLLLWGDKGDELLGDWAYDELGLVRSGNVRPFVDDLRLSADRSGRSLFGSLIADVLRPQLAHHAPRIASLFNRRRRGRPRPWAPWVPDELATRVDLADVIADARRLPRFDGYARSVRFHRLFSPQAARIAVLRNRTTARFGIGFADPFADRRLVDLVLALPQWKVHRRSRPKHLAREAMRGVMPETARRRVAKSIPVGLFERGFRDRAVPIVRTLLTNSRAASYGWLDESVAKAEYERYVLTGESTFDFWWVITVESWLRRWWD